MSENAPRDPNQVPKETIHSNTQRKRMKLRYISKSEYSSEPSIRGSE